jgi:hypothetical protein
VPSLFGGTHVDHRSGGEATAWHVKRLFVVKRGEALLTARRLRGSTRGLAYLADVTSSKRRPQLGQHSSVSGSALLGLDGFQLVSRSWWVASGSSPFRPWPR